MEEVVIEKLVHGGQGIGVLPDGRKIFAWNVLPGEKVLVRITKKRRQIIEGIAEEIIQASPDRVEPKDKAFLSTSPWQIMTFEAENRYKQEILEETLKREHVAYQSPILLRAGEQQWHYRNKMEYSFWADDEGLHLALFHRGSHGKQIVQGSSIAMPIIDEIAQRILAVLNKHAIRGSQLKTVMIRANQTGDVVAALFVKDQKFPKIVELDNIGKGITVYYSNPKSPASVLTKELYCFGDITLTDSISDHTITYNVHSFFQVNVPIFERALQRIRDATKIMQPVVDVYAGVGTIGLCVGATTMIEVDEHNAAMAQQNVQGKAIEVIQASSERVLEFIQGKGVVIFDPPRAGLHADLIDRIREVKPPIIIYLSCNPITQARDIALLQDMYSLETIEGYNFFPKTPHIESLAVMIRQ